MTYEERKRHIGGPFRIFFLLGGRGRGESTAPGGGGDGGFIENPRRERSPGTGRGRGGQEGACGELGNFKGGGGGGAKYFFSEPKCPPRKWHININFLVAGLGTTPDCPRDKAGYAPVTNWACPRGQAQVFFLFYAVEVQFVPGTNPVCSWDNSRDKGRQKKFMR